MAPRACLQPPSKSRPERSPRTRARHTASDFLAFLRQIERAYPEGDLAVVLDNVGSHKTPAVREWLDGHPRAELPLHPTSVSWLNQIET